MFELSNFKNINKISIFKNILILFSIFFTVSLIYTIVELRLYKLLLHQARLIKESEATISNKQGKLEKSKVFSYLDLNGAEKIVVYLENPNTYLKRNILIIDKENNKIGVPNLNIRDYSLWGNYLFQNNSGESFVPFGHFKSGHFNPNLNITNDEITFILPQDREFNHKNIVIDL